MKLNQLVMLQCLQRFQVTFLYMKRTQIDWHDLQTNLTIFKIKWGEFYYGALQFFFVRKQRRSKKKPYQKSVQFLKKWKKKLLWSHAALYIALHVIYLPHHSMHHQHTNRGNDRNYLGGDAIQIGLIIDVLLWLTLQGQLPICINCMFHSP